MNKIKLNHFWLDGFILGLFAEWDYGVSPIFKYLLDYSITFKDVDGKVDVEIMYCINEQDPNEELRDSFTVNSETTFDQLRQFVQSAFDVMDNEIRAINR